jgi:protein TonB
LALKNADEGYVVIQLTVSKQGRVVEPRVLEEKPKYRGFAKAALQAVKSNRYAPRFREGEVVETPDVLYKYTFQMAP